MLEKVGGLIQIIINKKEHSWYADGYPTIKINNVKINKKHNKYWKTNIILKRINFIIIKMLLT